MELLGRDATVSQALPKGKGSFARGCADRFTLYSHAGDMGQLLALKVGGGPLFAVTVGGCVLLQQASLSTPLLCGCAHIAGAGSRAATLRT